MHRWSAALVVLAALSCPSFAQQEASAARDAQERIFRDYIAALNRHDVEGQFSFYAPEMFYVDEGQRVTPNKESSRANREFEAANRALWSYKVLGADGENLDLLITEDMEYYQLLGVGARSHRARYWFRDGKIVKAEAWEWTSAGLPYEKTRDAFIAWVVRERPEAAARVVNKGRLRFDGKHAAEINRLVREWKAGQAKPSQ